MEYKDMNEWKENSEFNSSLIHDSMITSSMKKAKRDHRIKVAQTFSVLLFIPILTFTLLVNTNQQFVSAINDMPIMSDLIDMFKYNPSIYKARNTDGYQKIDKTYVTDDYTLYLESMVVDEDQIAIYYEVTTSLNDEKYSADMAIQEYEYYSSYPAGGWNFNELCGYVFDPQDAIDLDKFTLEFNISTNPGGEQIGEKLEIEIQNDVNKIIKGKTIELNQEMMIDDQKIIIEKIEVFALRSNIYIKQDPTNTKEIYSYRLSMLSEKGEIIEGISNGISAMHIDEYTDAILLESPFTIGGDIKVNLESVRWIDKDDKVMVFNNNTNIITNLPSYLDLIDVEDDQLTLKVTGKYPAIYGDLGTYIHHTDETVNTPNGIISYEVIIDFEDLTFNENNEAIIIDRLGYMTEVNQSITTIELD